jgi:hypothetical protein
VTRYKFTDSPMWPSGLRMVKLRDQSDPEPPDPSIMADVLQRKAELREAYEKVRQLAEACERMPSNVYRQKDLEEARAKLEALRFVWEDHAPSHQDKLKALAAHLREMWRRKMSEAQARVTAATEQLKSAQRDRAQEMREATRAQLAQIRKQRLAEEDKLEEVTATIKRRDGAIATAQRAVDVFTSRLTEHGEIKPEIAEALPEDPESQVWLRQQARLSEAHDQAIARRREVESVGPSKLEAVKLYERIQQLQRAERNLIGQLNGTGPAGGWKSSLSRVP